MPPAAPPSPIRTGSLQDRIRHAVEAEIMSGQRLPGSAIDEKALAERFEASRTPVREALLVLAAQGLVHIAPRAGIYVRQPSLAELMAALEALTEIESVVAALAARRATAEQCDELRAALDRTTARAIEGDVRAYERANLELHDILYGAAGNPVLVQTVWQLRRMLAAYRQQASRHPGRLTQSNAEHRVIVDAICAGDAEAAAQAMRRHIDLGGEAMVRLAKVAQAFGEGPRAEPPAF